MHAKLLNPEQRRRRDLMQAAGYIGGLIQESEWATSKIATQCAEFIKERAAPRSDSVNIYGTLDYAGDMQSAPQLPGTGLKIREVGFGWQTGNQGVYARIGSYADDGVPIARGHSITGETRVSISRMNGGIFAAHGNDDYRGLYRITPSQTPHDTAESGSPTFRSGEMLIKYYGERHKTALCTSALLAECVGVATETAPPLERVDELLKDWATVLGDDERPKDQELWQISPTAEVNELLHPTEHL